MSNPTTAIGSAIHKLIPVLLESHQLANEMRTIQTIASETLNRFEGFQSSSIIASPETLDRFLVQTFRFAKPSGGGGGTSSVYPWGVPQRVMQGVRHKRLTRG